MSEPTKAAMRLAESVMCEAVNRGLNKVTTGHIAQALDDAGLREAEHQLNEIVRQSIGWEGRLAKTALEALKGDPISEPENLRMDEPGPR